MKPEDNKQPDHNHNDPARHEHTSNEHAMSNHDTNPQQSDAWNDARLEAALRQIAADPEQSSAEPSALEAALIAERRAARQPSAGNLWFRHNAWAIAACIALLLIGFAAVAILPSITPVRSVALDNHQPPPLSGATESMPPASLADQLAMGVDMSSDSAERLERTGTQETAVRMARRPPPRQASETSRGSDDAAFPAFGPLSTTAPTAAASAPTVPRLIIRDGAMTLKVDDVDAAIGSLRSIVRAERGEFVESLRRSTPREAVLVLKLESARMMGVVDEISGLGEVTAEQMSGRDVTDQAIDLEARIRNAERVEQELLDLLERRDDQPLRDVLELQRELGNARQQIERLVAQRDGLVRMATLGTLRVTVFAEVEDADEPEPDEPDEHFFMGMADAWRDGLGGIQSTLEFLVRVLVGGAVMWLMLGLGAAALWSSHRRHAGYAV